MSETIQKYLEKSEESLASAKNDLSKKRYNSCANRAYYACYQAAVALLLKYNLTPAGGKELRKHGVIQSQIATLIKRKKILLSKHRDTLPELMSTRVTADYESKGVGQKKAKRVLKRAEEFVTLVNKEILE